MTGAVLRAGVLMAPGLVPQRRRAGSARSRRPVPAGRPRITVWWTVLAVCAVAIAVSLGGRSLPRGCPVFRDPGDDGLEASRTPPCGQPHPPRRPTPFCLGRPVRSVDGT